MPVWLRNFGAFALWSILILLLFLIPGQLIPPIPDFYTLLQPDKVLHLALFSVFVYLLLQSIRRQYGPGFLRYRGMIIALLSGTIYGATTESLQYFLAINRSGNYYDFLVNVVGCLVGTVIFFTVLRKNNVKADSD